MGRDKSPVNDAIYSRMYLLIIILKKSEFMAAQRARPILLNERFLVIGERAKRVSLSLIM